MYASEELLEDKVYLKTEIKKEYDLPLSISPEDVPVKDEPWLIDLNKIKSESDFLDFENETNVFVANNELQSITNIKTEDNEKVKHIDNNNTIERLYGIKCEDVEIKSEENCRDIPLQSLKDELDDPTNAKTMNNSNLKCKTKRYHCESCDYKTNFKQSLTQHQLRHIDIPEEQMLKCNWCEYKTGQKLYLKRHEQGRHTGIPKKYKCDLCDFETTSKTCLPRHKLKHKDIPEEQMFKCNLCDYKTRYKNGFTRHLIIHKDVPEEQMYKCDFCDYKALFKSYVAKHQLRHTGEQMLKCDLCDYKTVYKNCLKIHQLKHINIPKQHKCESCDYKTKFKHSLTRHQLIHKGISEEQTFKCDLCEFITGQKLYLKRHEQRRHADMPKKFQCETCDYKTNFKHCLAQHQLKHISIPEEQKFKCDWCDYKTGQKLYLKRHEQRRHTGNPKEYNRDSCQNWC